MRNKHNKLTQSEIMCDAKQYWERWRTLYNIVLINVTILTYFLGVFLEEYPLDFGYVYSHLKIIAFFAILANLAYNFAYLAELDLQQTEFRNIWRNYRWVAFVAGTLFASYLTFIISMRIFSPCGIIIDFDCNSFGEHNLLLLLQEKLK